MTSSIIALSMAYTTLAVVLLVMGLRSSYKWWIKGVAVVITSAFFVVAFYKTRSLLGWPGIAALPPKFQLLWVRVLEPNRAYQEPGAIFMWVEELDENNTPSGVPRAYKLKYTAPLAEKAEKAKEQIMSGNQQQGTAEDMAADNERETNNPQPTSSQPPPADAERAEQGLANLDPEFLQNLPQRVEFAPLQGPLLPVKGPR